MALEAQLSMCTNLQLARTEAALQSTSIGLFVPMELEAPRSMYMYLHAPEAAVQNMFIALLALVVVVQNMYISLPVPILVAAAQLTTCTSQPVLVVAAVAVALFNNRHGLAVVQEEAVLASLVRAQRT